MIRVLFFDAGGTLLHPAEPVGKTYARIAASHGWTGDEEKFEKGFRMAWKKRREEGAGADRTLGKEGWKRIVYESAQIAQMPVDFSFSEYFEEVYEAFARPQAWRDFPETGGVIEAVRRKGVQVGLLSNWDPRLRTVLSGFSWAKDLDPILISEEWGVEKPGTGFFRKAEEVVGVRSHECALIGDDPKSDHAGAEGAGWLCSLVDRPKKGLWEALEDLRL